ncbi:CRISPR-associated helicase/endonuclease Cas3 [Streptomyces niveus]|uniref:CRISPR-associated helicase/endonuclease Cas3 n=1 Tax=Streptomyces niveus TaxID=193462 RepID=A0A1U9R0Q1_STRNV|nr:CRISPR-associated helicase/endonuclease Cas3 [Streptomyces niveus]AQU70076.1 CRISPR-associated helicase/endonuclease Cas3 [Streptomyces niveus]
MTGSHLPVDGRHILGALGVLWGKSEEKAGGTMNLLLSHLLDTAAVAERLWEGFLAPATKSMLDGVAGGAGKGRRLFAWLCGVHDCGKATPAFQRMWPKGAEAIRAAGLGWHEPTVSALRWRHDRAGAYVLRRVLPAAGWTEAHVAWVWPLVAGHHGSFPRQAATNPPRKARGESAGRGLWPQVQLALVERLTAELEFGDLLQVEPVRVPSRAEQLHLSGLIVMADWIASDERHFKGIDRLSEVCIGEARRRAAGAWESLRFHKGWGQLEAPRPETFRDRFGRDPRLSQTLVMDAARRMEAPGLLVVEAPMGEGKTQAAFMAAEILAARFGADGVFVGMPTQSTSDPMFTQVRDWVGDIDQRLSFQVALLHGKRMFNREWRDLLEGAEGDPEGPFGGVDAYGECEGDDLYGEGVAALHQDSSLPVSRGPAEWFLGAKRGLLCPFVVGTIDQLLFAVTRTKHVMLRMAGLAGKVVVLDEVHAADVYMSQFLTEGLRWLGQCGVPVVLLSATLPPGQRRQLTDAYLGGAASREEFTAGGALTEPQGYPSVTAAWMAPDDSGAQFDVSACGGWRDDLNVALELMPEEVAGPEATREAVLKAQEAADASVTAYLGLELEQGGCALVIRNTVERAQTLYSVLREEFGDDVLLLHGRIAVGPRADRTEQCLGLLGPPKEGHPAQRPHRLIVVATQLAEQSFDVDADLLITDLAPVDLLLQRIGRLHRHADVTRPGQLAAPRVVITGFGGHKGRQNLCAPGACGTELDERAPQFLGGSEFIYGRHLLLRTAALLFRDVEGAGAWAVPGRVPGLVAAVYGPGDGLVPEAWCEDAAEARQRWETRQRERAENAARFLLTRRGDKEGLTLAGLHHASLPAAGRGAGLDAVVRDGEPSAEVVLVIREGDSYRTLRGRSLTANGDVSDDLLDEVLGGTVRLPASLSSEAVQTLVPLPGWLGHPRLRYSRALVLDPQRSAVLAERQVRYDEAMGLVVGDRVTGVRAGS